MIDSQAEEVLPPQFNFDRYSKMVDNSPFAVATAVAAPAATPDFAKDLYIANAARSPDGDMVTLASTSDHNFKKYLTTKEPMDGYSIANIEWSDKVGATKVTISKDGNFATITFNQALLSQSAPNAGLASRAVCRRCLRSRFLTLANVPNPALSKLPPGCTGGTATVDSQRRRSASFAWLDSAKPAEAHQPELPNQAHEGSLPGSAREEVEFQSLPHNG